MRPRSIAGRAVQRAQTMMTPARMSAGFRLLYHASKMPIVQNMLIRSGIQPLALQHVLHRIVSSPDILSAVTDHFVTNHHASANFRETKWETPAAASSSEHKEEHKAAEHKEHHEKKKKKKRKRERQAAGHHEKPQHRAPQPQQDHASQKIYKGKKGGSYTVSESGKKHYIGRSGRIGRL